MSMDLNSAKVRLVNKDFHNEAGQALLIVLLSMAVVLTIVLSIISFSVTDISVTTRESEALRAFSAAEAGVEKALVALTAQSGTFGSDTFNADISSIAEGSTFFNYPLELAGGETANVWFVAHDDNDNLSCSDPTKPCFRGSMMTLCWGKEGTVSGVSDTPAVEVSVYYSTPPVVARNYSGIRIARDVFDPNSGRRGSNSFSAPDQGGCVIDNKSYAFKKVVDFATLGIPAASYNASNGLQMAHIRFLYNTTTQSLGFDFGNLPGSGNTTLPSQGRKINSTGTAGESTRLVEVYKLYSDLAGVFEASLFSNSGLSK